MTLELPPARYHEPQLDLERSRVYDRDRGVIDRLQSLFGDDTGTDPEVYTLAEEKLAAAARGGSGLLQARRAEHAPDAHGPPPLARLHARRDPLRRGLAVQESPSSGQACRSAEAAASSSFRGRMA